MPNSGGAGLRSSLERGLELNVRRRPAAALRVLRELQARLDEPAYEAVAETEKAYVRARALVGEASCLVETSGDVAQALTLLTEADDLAVRHGLQPLRGAILGQRGLLKHRTGDLDGALSDITAALDPVIDKEPRDSIKLLLNLGSLRLDRGEVDAAMDDLRRSAELAQANDEVMLSVLATHNLGYAQYLRGDLPAALTLMRRAAAEASDNRIAALDMGEAQVLYEAGLLAEAVKVLDSARRTLQATRMSRDLADVELLLSQCLRDLRRHEPSAAWARSAARRFARLGNEPWRLRAHVAELQARLGADQFRPRVPRAAARDRAERALRLAEQGDELGPTATLAIVVPARLMAAEWLLMARDVERARALVEGLPRDLRYASLPVRLQREAVLAQIAFADLDRRAGRTAVSRGQRILATHRASLGSVDAVTASAVHGLRLQILDIKWAMRRGKGDAVFDALERGRATFSGPGRVRPSADARMAELLVKARAEIESARLLGPTASGQGLAARQQHLQEARRLQELARARSWHLSGETRPPRPVTARRLRSALTGGPAAGAVVVNLAMLDGRVIAVRSDRNGTSLHRLAPLSDVVERVRRARADFEVLANPLIPAALRTSAHASLDRVLRWLDDELVAPLAVEGDLHLAVRGMLLTVAWSALPSRRGRRTWVNSRVEVFEASAEERRSEVVVVSGPGLDSSGDEVKRVADAWGGATLISGAEATCQNVLGHLGPGGVVHLAAHGTHEPDNPLFSSLRLVDGPLFAYELDGVDLAGTVVVLSACEVGLSTADAGGEALGLTSVLLRHGARAVIAAVAPLRDDVAARVMPTLHANLHGGVPPGQALAAAVAEESEPVPLACFGPLVL